MQNTTSAPLFLILALVSAGCSSGGGEGPVGTVVPASLAPTVTVTEPVAATQIDAGESITVRWLADDPDSEARTDVVAVRLSDGLEQAIASDVPEQDGTEQSVDWSPTGGDTGLYRIEARVTDGVSTVVDAAPGFVQYGPELFLETRAEVVLSGGEATHVAAQADGSFAFGSRLGPGFDFEYLLAEPAPLSVSPTELEVAIGFHGADGAYRGLARIRASSSGGPAYAGDDFAAGVVLRGLEPLPGGGFLAAAVFGGTVTVGLGEPNEATYVDSFGNGESALLVAFDGFGRVLWSRRPVLGFQDAQDMVIAPTPTGFVLLLEIDEGSVIAPGDPNETLIEEYTEPIFTGWNADGSLRFVRPVADLGDPSYVYGYLVDSGPAGVTIAAMFEGDLEFGVGTPDEVVLEQGPVSDEEVLVARFTHDGDFQWVQRIGAVVEPTGSDASPELIEVEQLADGGCRVLIQLRDAGTYVIGEGSPNAVTAFVDEEQDGDVNYLVAYGPNGTFGWAARTEGLDMSDNRPGRIVEVDSGEVWLCASMDDEATLFPASSEGQLETLFAESTPGLGRWAVARYDTAGEILWALDDSGDDEPEMNDAVRVPGAVAPQLLILGQGFGFDTFEFGTNSLPTVPLGNPSGAPFSLYAVYDAEGGL